MNNTVSLTDYLPDLFKDISEFKILLESEDITIQSLWQTIMQSLDNQFILTSDIQGIERWEKILSIVPELDDDLETRRYRCLTVVSLSELSTMRKLQEKLETICGKDNIEMVFESDLFTLHIKVKNNSGKAKMIENYILESIPANLVLDFKSS